MRDLPLSDLHAAAAALDDEARTALYRGLERRHPGITTSSHALIEAAPATDDVLPPLPSLRPAPLAPGTRLGTFVVGDLLGEGGMGRVYRAEQQDPERAVALKVAAPGLFDSSVLLDRFRTERNTVGSFEHPHIAHVYDGGETPDARPYFAMELVEGLPITAWCEAHDLDARARVALFCQVCDAVAYAHQRLVVHRDLKPSNILVRGDDEDQPVAKLLDFGIAAVLAEAGGAISPEHGGMTPGYAAPEQYAGTTITTATDVYALGVVLHEVLTGQRPVEGAVDVDAPRLDTDLTAIITRALDPTPEQRYQTAQALGNDLRRYLSGFPVEARPATLSYRAHRFVARHRAGVGAAALALAVLVAVVAVYTWQLREERDAAQVAQQQAERVNAFTASLFEEAQPEVAQGDTLTAFDLLDRGQERIATELADEPASQVVLMRTLGGLRIALGQFDRAQDILQESVALARSVGDSLEVAANLIQLGGTYQRLGDFEAAVRAYSQAVALEEAEFGVQAANVGDGYYHIGMALRAMGRYTEARESLETSFAIVQRAHPPDHPFVLRVRHGLADLLGYEGAYEEALVELYALQEAQERVFGDSLHMDMVRLANDLGWTHNRLGDHVRAAEHYATALEVARELYGDLHPHVLTLLNNVGNTLQKAEEPERARASYLEALDISLHVLPQDHHIKASILSNLGSTQYQVGAYEAALDRKRAALAMAKRVFRDPHPLHAQIQVGIGKALGMLGRDEDARIQFTEVLAIRRTIHGDTHPEVAQALHDFAEHERQYARWATAAAFDKEAVEMLQELDARSLPLYPTSLVGLASDLIELGDYDQARLHAVEAARLLREQKGPTHEETREAEALVHHLSTLDA